MSLTSCFFACFTTLFLFSGALSSFANEPASPSTSPTPASPPITPTTLEATKDYPEGSPVVATPRAPLPLPGFRRIVDPVIVTIDPFAKSSVVAETIRPEEEVTAAMIDQALEALKVGGVFLVEPNNPTSRRNRVIVNRQPYGVGSLLYIDDSLPPVEIERITSSAVAALMKEKSFIIPISVRPSFSNRATKVMNLDANTDPSASATP
jgi:hypothetical protein